MQKAAVAFGLRHFGFPAHRVENHFDNQAGRSFLPGGDFPGPLLLFKIALQNLLKNAVSQFFPRFVSA